MENNKRWIIAQNYERNWWEKRIEYIDFQFYESFAKEFKNFSNGFLNINEDTKILEIGSGAGGILTFLKESNNRYAIDPLENFYAKVPHFYNQRDKTIKYFAAKGEKLPFKRNYFDLIIMDNVLDHCENPEKVIGEIKRVIKSNGIIFFKQNTYHIWGKFIRFLMEQFLIDKGHPYTFLKRDLKILLKNFKILKSSRTGYFYTWKKEFFSRNKNDKIKAVLFVNRDKVTYLLKPIH